MPNVTSTSYNVWRKLDSETQRGVKNGKVVADHRASAAANFEEAGSTFKSIGYGWQAVAQGKAIMGGGNPADRVARAEGAWNKTKTAFVQHGSNALMALALTVMGAVGGVVDTVHGVAHGVASLFQGSVDSGAAAAVRGVTNLDN